MNVYVLRICPGEWIIQRDQVIQELKKCGIGASVHLTPLHLHSCYRKRWSYRRGDFPIVEDYFVRCISLPLYPAMADDDQSRVIDALIEIAHRNRRTIVPVPHRLSDVVARDGEFNVAAG